MKITDLLDGYRDSEVVLPEVPYPTAAQTLKRTREKLGIKGRKRIRTWTLVAAALVVLFGITAGAYYITHEKTVALMETGPNSGGRQTVALEEENAQVIDGAAMDYGITVTDNGTAVTLESVMGSRSEKLSIVYLTLTVSPPEGTTLPEILQDWGFLNWSPKLSAGGLGADGSQTVAVQEDGTVGVMLMYLYRGDVGGQAMELTLEDFGCVGKEARAALEAGTSSMELSGKWSFSIDRLTLEDAKTLTPDPALFAKAKAVPTEITLSEFGCAVSMEGGMITDDLTDALEEIQDKYPDLDWANMSLEQLQGILAEGVFTEAETELLEEIMACTPEPFTVQIRYMDGSVYAEATCLGSGKGTTYFLFEAPQNLSQAQELIINGVEIPLT